MIVLSKTIIYIGCHKYRVLEVHLRVILCIWDSIGAVLIRELSMFQR